MNGRLALLDRLRRKAADRRTPIFYAGLLTEAHDEIVLLRAVLALAAGFRRAKTPKAVECKASQSGGDSRNAQGGPA